MVRRVLSSEFACEGIAGQTRLAGTPPTSFAELISTARTHKAQPFFRRPASEFELIHSLDPQEIQTRFERICGFGTYLDYEDASELDTRKRPPRRSTPG